MSRGKVRAPATSTARSTWWISWSRSMSELSRRTLLTGALMSAADAQPKYRLIDPHVHVWKHDPAFPFAQGANVPARDADPETLRSLMKANGVERTVLIQYIAYRWDNAFVLSVLKKYPGTFQA